MILCRKCIRVWPAGSVYCQSCGASLGVRICVNQHCNSLEAKYCKECGSNRLSRGVRSLNLRWLTWLLAAFLLLVVAYILERISVAFLYPAIYHLLMLLRLLVAYAVVWTILLALICGPKGRDALARAWAGLFLGLTRALIDVAKLLIRRKGGRKL